MTKIAWEVKLLINDCLVVEIKVAIDVGSLPITQ